MKRNSFMFSFAFCAGMSFRFNHGTINCAISPVSAINHVSHDAPRRVRRFRRRRSQSQRVFSCRERKRDSDFFFYEGGGSISLSSGSYDKGWSMSHFCQSVSRNYSRRHNRVRSRTRARIQRRRSGATRLSRTEPCYSCTFYTRRHSTGQWHPALSRETGCIAAACRCAVASCMCAERTSLI